MNAPASIVLELSIDVETLEQAALATINCQVKGDETPSAFDRKTRYTPAEVARNAILQLSELHETETSTCATLRVCCGT
jgi:hypothetical protein